MRIAICGAHHTGKTMLSGALAAALPGHFLVDEPYRLLEEEGHQFAHPPAVEDFELQLELSVKLTSGDEPNRIFDRCPADFLGYLLTSEDADSFDIDAWLPGVAEAMSHLDLVVFCGIERPDRFAMGPGERAWRRRIDEILRDIVVGDRWDWRIPTIEVNGDPEERLAQVLAAVRQPA